MTPMCQAAARTARRRCVRRTTHPSGLCYEHRDNQKGNS